MSMIEAIFSRQTELGAAIERLLINYNKDSKDRKTKDYLTTKLNILTEYWVEFEKNDDYIRANNPDLAHHYFTKEYFQQVEGAYLTLKEKIEQLKATITVPEKPVEMVKQNNKLHILGNSLHSAMATLEGVLARASSMRGQSASVLEHLIGRIEKFQNIISNKEREVLESVTTEALPYSQEEFQNLQSKAEDMIIQLKMSLNEVNTDLPSTCMITQPSVKLNQISIPKFNGDRSKWHQFHDLFYQLVDQQDISKALKMFYLKDNLSGEAEQVIRHLVVTDANYDAAWAILKNKYDDKRELVNSWLRRIVNQKPVQIASSDGIKKIHDSVREATLALESLNIPPKDLWNAIVLYLTADKLDSTSRTLYEQSLTEPQNLQSLESFIKFLHTRYRSLSVQTIDKPKQNRSSMMAVNTDCKLKCPICTKDHVVYYCDQLLKMNIQARKEAIYKAKLCINCLKSGHFANKCTSRTCFKCKKRHNTLLHSSAPISAEVDATVTATTNISTTLSVDAGDAILGTAIVDIKNADNKWIQCRVLIDSGSQVHIATEKLQRKLKLDGFAVNSRVAGLGESRLTINNRLNLEIRSRNSEFSTSIDALVMKKITSVQPQQYVSVKGWHIPNDIVLADPRFNIPQGIDLLLGVELYGDLIRPNQRSLGANMPVLQESSLGWLIMGSVKNVKPHEDVFCGIGSVDLDDQIKKFWELEEYIPQRRFTIEETKCEALFDTTTIRRNGRYEVKLPLHRNPTVLGESKNLAYKRLISLEKRLKNNKDVQEQYITFMRDYEQRGHMEEISSEDVQGVHFYIPHHFVLKPSSSTTKLRVVFDASAKSTNNISLNEIMMAGPRIQDDLFGIILRFRTKRYVFTADIQQMYRQILVANEDRNLQLILWRENDTMPVKTFRLCTVTYGTKSAPYLATKCLQRLAEDENDKFPLGSKAARDFYVDDIITGADDINELIESQKQLRQLLEAGGFRLRKWCANHPQLLENVDSQDMELQLNFDSKDDGCTKPLGLTWHPVADHFQITVKLKSHDRITKRSVLSNTASLFDPLGLVNPVIVMAKIYMQRLWKLNIDWDDKLPLELQDEWHKYENELHKLHELMVPRYVFATEHSGNIILHAFADASEKAYGAAIYLRSQNESGEIVVRLLCARSRVAPLKQTKLPLLELCAAKLAAELVKVIIQNLSLAVDKVYYWSDSEIVLCWINRDAATLKTFVANRVGDIQSLSDPRNWRYVPSQQNPADLVSRGCTPQQLIKEKCWFDGPDFLKKSKGSWPKQPQEKIVLKEFERTLKCILTTNQPELSIIEHMNHGNSFLKMQRIIAFVLRGIHNFKSKVRRTLVKDQKIPNLTVEELDAASIAIFGMVQRATYSDEIHSISRNEPLKKGNNLTSLAPFIGDHGLLRVGGRLQHSALSYNEQHPILLPPTHYVTRLYMTLLHLRHLHAGPQALTAISRQRIWVPQGRQLARSIVNNCIRCVRAKPLLANQIMGQLPAHRVTPARPFINCGVDFCGPIWTHFKIRGKKPQKTYLAVFCCFATKAVHIEVVSELTTDAFIGSLKRFMSRRGSCKNIYCDNAKNFVGARNQISELQDIKFKDNAREKIEGHCNQRCIQFHFIPPRAPHMGGLWEAAVKSAKQLLCRTVASTALTYEELCTVVAEIESVLNSRPITPMSSDPNDLTALTPGHFLIGEPITAAVDPHASSANMSLLSRWQLVSFCRAEFWKRWSTEYLTNLQQRAKWAKEYPNMMVGTLVLIKEDNCPPLQWPLGRILELITGCDGHVRVADIRTSTGTIRRAIHRLAPLPIEGAEQEEFNGVNSGEPDSNNKNDDGLSTDESQADNIRRKNRQAPSEDKSCKRRRSTNYTGLSTVLILTLLMIPFITANHVKIQQFEHNSGIYYHLNGQLRLSPTEWTIMAYIKLDRYEIMEEEIRTALSRMKIIASKMERPEPYDDIINHFEEQLVRTRQYNDVLLYDAITGGRAKRAAINVVGTVFNKLFGLLDDDYAQSMKTTIDTVQGNEVLLKQLLDNHTSILDATINIFKRDQQKILNQTLRIKKLMHHEYTNISNQITQEAVERRSIDMFNLLSVLVTSHLREYNQIQDTIADISFGLVQGHTSLHVITPQQLQNQLNLITQQLPTTLTLPQVDRNDLRPFYRLMVTQGRVSKGFFLFKIQIPLLSQNQFQLYKLIPVPVLVNNTQLTIRVTTEYLAVDLRRNQFYALTENDIEKCKTVAANIHVCRQTRALDDDYSGNYQCESQLILAKTLPTACAVTYSHSRSTWTQLGSTGTWLFSVVGLYDITVICEDGITERISIENSGILSLEKGCTMRAKNVTLTSYHELTTTVSFINQPRFNLSHFVIVQNNTTSNPVASEDTIDNSTFNNDINILHEQLHRLQKEQNELKQLQPKDIHHYTISATALVLIILIIIYLGYRIKVNQTKKKKQAVVDGTQFVLHSLHRERPEDVVVE